MSGKYELMPNGKNKDTKMDFLENLLNNKINSSNVKSDTSATSVKVFIGSMLSFFILCYMFSFNLYYVIPLTLITLLTFAILIKSKKVYVDYIKRIRRCVRKKMNSFKSKDSILTEYKLMEI
jgi:hypothetical protein